MMGTLFSVSPSVFSWSMLGRGLSSAAFQLPRPEKGVAWLIPRWTHPARVAVVALLMTDLVSISGNAATGRATWRHLSPSPVGVLSKGVLVKDMATVDGYLQTWNLKLSTTKTVSAAFHLNNNEAKRELKVNPNNKNLPFCSEPKYLGVTFERSLTYRRHPESLAKSWHHASHS